MPKIVGNGVFRQPEIEIWSVFFSEHSYHTGINSSTDVESLFCTAIFPVFPLYFPSILLPIATLDEQERLSDQTSHYDVSTIDPASSFPLSMNQLFNICDPSTWINDLGKSKQKLDVILVRELMANLIRF